MDTRSIETYYPRMLAIIFQFFSRSTTCRTLRLVTLVVLGTGVSACTVSSYQAKPVDVPDAWSTDDRKIAIPADANSKYEWWAALGDPSVNTLIDAALGDNPSLSQAIARIGNARAELGFSAANRYPVVGMSAGLNRGSAQISSGKSSTEMGTSASFGPTVSWELDLFGRLRSAKTAAENRLEARIADSRNVRISVTTRIAEEVLAWRACIFVQARKQGIAISLSKNEQLTSTKAAAGMAAPIEVLRAHTQTSSANSDASSQATECERSANALVALSGLRKTEVKRILQASPLAGILLRSTDQMNGRSGASCNAPDSTSGPCIRQIHFPEPPDVGLSLPAVVLAGHPGVIAAEHEAEAAWADIQASKADRWPRVDLLGILTMQYLTVAGSSANFLSWSAGPNISGTLFDGGRGRASVDGAEARYRDALASLQSVLRSSTRDIEDALSRLSSTADALNAMRSAERDNLMQLSAAAKQSAAGKTSSFDFESAHRRYDQSGIDLAFAARDHAQAWVALVRATGNNGWGTFGESSRKGTRNGS